MINYFKLIQEQINNNYKIIFRKEILEEMIKTCIFWIFLYSLYKYNYRILFSIFNIYKFKFSYNAK